MRVAICSSLMIRGGIVSSGLGVGVVTIGSTLTTFTGSGG